MCSPKIILWGSVISLLCWLISTAAAQSQPLSAVITVLAQDVSVQQANTTDPLPLRAGSVAPLGAGDRLITGANGRATLAFSDDFILYLLPQTTYRLDDLFRDSNGSLTISGTLEAGVVIQQRLTTITAVTYQMVTPALTVTLPSELFIVWSVPGQVEAAISAEGDLTVIDADQPTQVMIPAGSGLFAPFGDQPLALQPPYHAAQLLGKTIDCAGTVNIRGATGLRLRRGAALDYPIAGLLDDKAQVKVVGTTLNGLWYRVSAKSEFGWLYSALVVADCDNLQTFPDLVAEIYEEITDVTAPEVAWLTPFYGTPADNLTFYR